MSESATDFEGARLEAQRARHRQQLEIELDASREAQSGKDTKRKKREAAIDEHFREYERWLRDSVETEDEPYMQILAVITGDKGEPIVAGGRSGEDAAAVGDRIDSLTDADPSSEPNHR